MSTRFHETLSSLKPVGRRRSPWRQRLVEAERGIVHSVRGDSLLFAHFFLSCLIFTTAVVLQISLIEWAVLCLAFCLVIAAELFQKALVTVVSAVEGGQREILRHALRIGTAAVLVSIIGASVAVLIVLGSKLVDLVRAF